jgi:hypothetical protein
VANANTTVSIRGTNKMGRKLSSSLLTQSLNHVMRASPKPLRWYDRLGEYKKKGLVRKGLRRRMLAKIYQMLKKGAYHYRRDPQNREFKMAHYRRLLEQQKERVFLKKTA